MINSAALDFEVSAWSFTHSFSGNGRRANGRRIDLKLKLQNPTDNLELSDGSKLRSLPTQFALYPGEPPTGAGKIEGGLGYWSHHKERESDGDFWPASVSGWAVIPVSDFDQIWILLSRPAGMTIGMIVDVGPVTFDTMSCQWDLSKEPLIVHNVQCSVLSAGWNDDV